MPAHIGVALLSGNDGSRSDSDIYFPMTPEPQGKVQE